MELSKLLMCDWSWWLAQCNWVCRISQSCLTIECLSSNRTSHITNWLIAYSIYISKHGLVQFLSVYGGGLRFSWRLAYNHTGKGNSSLGRRTQMTCSQPSTPLSLWVSQQESLYIWCPSLRKSLRVPPHGSLPLSITLEEPVSWCSHCSSQQSPSCTCIWAQKNSSTCVRTNLASGCHSAQLAFWL